MQQEQTINIADQLRGMPVREEGTEQMLGRLADIVIHPTEGTMLGLILQTVGGNSLSLATSHLCIDTADINTASITIRDSDRLNTPLSGGVRVWGELIGACVVTEEGLLLGHVREIHLWSERQRYFSVVYRVSGTLLQRLFAQSFFLPGHIVQAYSRAGTRLIVPARTKELYALTSLAEKKRRPQTGTLSAKEY